MNKRGRGSEMRLSRAVILLAAAAIVIFPAGVALAYPPAANPVRALPDTVERGGTFNVTVNFTAPGDDFNSISVTDFAPAGWNVTVDKTWCQPKATNVKPTDNMAELTWNGPYGNGTNFTAMYKVTVPCGASLENYTFFDYGEGLKYYVGNSSVIKEGLTGDFNVTVVPPAICSTANITFYAAPGQNPANKTLELWSSTPCPFNVINWSITEIDAGWLEAYPTNGSCTNVPSVVNLSVNTSGMSLGNYTANITIESPDANNSPHIVPVTLHVTDKGILKGEVNFTGRGSYGPRWIESFEVKLFEHGNLTNVLWAGNATTDENGVFGIFGIIPATYDIGIKNSTCLSKLVTNVTMNAGMPTEVPFGEILEGDATNDDYIDFSDYGPLSSAWLSYPGCSPPLVWDSNVDFNRDNYIDFSDYGPLSSNWLQWGDLFGI